MRQEDLNQILRLRDERSLGYAEYGGRQGAPVFHCHSAGSSRLEHPGQDDDSAVSAVRLVVADRPGHGLSSFQKGRLLLDGDRVRVGEWHPPGHTRCPGYIRGKNRTVVRVDGIHSVPDIEAHGTARRREPTYSVRFDAADLWRDGQRGVWVHVDLWDSYLERS